MKIKFNFSKNKWVILFILLGFILLISFFYSKKSLFEGFGSSQYSYLAPIPDGTTWSQETQDAWTKKPNLPGLSYIMPQITEEEAKQFLETGMWPYTDYVKELYKQASDQKLAIPGFGDVSTIPIETAQKGSPNRFMYAVLAQALKISPEPLAKLNEEGGNPSTHGYDIGDNNRIVCGGSTRSDLYIWKYIDGVGQGGAPGTGASTDYTLFEKIPGFKFNSTPYNICDQKHKIDFTFNGEGPSESYSIYTGSIAGPTESTPSSVSSVSNSLSSIIPSSSSSSSSSDTSSNPQYYNDFVSLCKKVVQ